MTRLVVLLVEGPAGSARRHRSRRCGQECTGGEEHRCQPAHDACHHIVDVRHRDEVAYPSMSTSSTTGMERGRLTMICTMAMMSTAMVNARSREEPPRTVRRSGARREALRHERQCDGLPAVHLDRIEPTRVREPRGVGDRHQAAEPESVEHGVRAVAVTERVHRVHRVGQAQAVSPNTSASHIGPARHPISARTPSMAPTMIASAEGIREVDRVDHRRRLRVAGRRFEEDATQGVTTTNITITPSIHRCSSKRGTRSRTKSTRATTSSGYQANQKTSETVEVASGSPRMAQITSPAAHNPIATAMSNHADPVALRPDRRQRAEHRGESLGRATHPFIEQGVDPVAAEVDEPVHREADHERDQHDEQDAHERRDAVVPHRERARGTAGGGGTGQPPHPNDRAT